MTAMISRRPAFWIWAILIVVANFLLIGAVVLPGYLRDVVPTRIMPADRATAVSTRPTILVRYPTTMDAASLRAAFRLDPAVPGSVDVNGRELTFRPSQALQPDADYTITLRAGLRDVGGRAAREDVQATFHTRSSRLIVLRTEGGRANAWAVDPASGKSWQITDEPQGLGAVAASPDGEELAYVTPDGPGQWALWAVKVAGGGRRPILRHQDGVVTSVAWSPRGDVLAYSGAQTTGGQSSNPRIWLVRSDGSQSNLVYGRSQEAGSTPIWSPDGQRLAFYENHFAALAIYNFTRSLQTVPSDGQTTGSWSPDGAGLVYLDRTGATNAQSVLRVADVGRPGAMVNAGGSPSTRQITEGSGNVFNPSWSPTSGWIAFTRLAATGQSGVWVVDSSGANERPLQQDRGWLYTNPIWSPDGRSVAFSRRPTSDPRALQTWVAPLDGQPRDLGQFGQIVAWTP